MAYLDVMSDAAYGRYNRKLAKLAGLQSAVYWSEVLDIIGHVIKKNAFDAEGYFKLDRKYIEGRTGLTLEVQTECDVILNRMGVLEVHPTDTNRVGVRCEEMMKILISSDEERLKNIEKSTKVSAADKRANKKAGIIGRLKSELVEPNLDLYEAYCNWIDVVYDKGVVKTSQVKIFQDAVNTYTKDDLEKIDLIKVCTVHGYRDAAWGIQLYEKSTGKKKTPLRLSDQKIATNESINTNVKF